MYVSYLSLWKTKSEQEMWMFYFLFWTAVRAREPLNKKTGDKAVLRPVSVENPLTSISWKHGPDIAMEWFGNKTFSYRHFKDRGSLDVSTGAMMITGLTGDDSGIYTVEINNRVNSQTQLLVISPVPKPTISVSCDPEKTSCVLTCDANTTGAEPVTYWWTAGEKMWTSTKELRITKEGEEQWFSCSLENPVSFISSEKVFNPFIKEPLYRKIGDKAVLTPDSVQNHIISIRWKHGHYTAMVWHQAGGKTFSYRQFRVCASLNISTGVMTITGLTGDLSGIYTVEINNKVNSKTQLLVISPVPKPTIYVLCDVEMTYCVLTCDGDTTDAEPVTYWWTAGEKRWNSTKELRITKEEEQQWFNCTLENPVSSSSSEKIFSSLMKRDWTISILISVVAVLFLCTVIIIAMTFYFRCKCIKGPKRTLNQTQITIGRCYFKEKRDSPNKRLEAVERWCQENRYSSLSDVKSYNPYDLDSDDELESPPAEEKTSTNEPTYAAPPGTSNEDDLKPQRQHGRRSGGLSHFRNMSDPVIARSVANDDAKSLHQESLYSSLTHIYELDINEEQERVDTSTQDPIYDAPPETSNEDGFKPQWRFMGKSGRWCCFRKKEGPFK